MLYKLHVVLKESSGGHDIIIERGRDFRAGHDGPSIPQKLLFQAAWIFDLTRNKILKNSTDHAFIPSIAATEVPEDWLWTEGFTIRLRDIGVPGMIIKSHPAVVKVSTC